jgi:hypothetical protein
LNYRKRKREAGDKIKLDLEWHQSSTSTLETNVSSMHAGIMMLQAERDSLQGLIVHLKNEVDSANKRAENLSDELAKQIEHAHASDENGTKMIRQLKSSLIKAEKKAGTLAALAAEKLKLAEEKEKLVGENERVLRERGATIKSQEKRLKKEAATLEKRKSEVDRAEAKIAALMLDDVREDDNDEEVSDAAGPDAEVLQAYGSCDGVGDADALSRLDTTSFPRGSKVSIIKEAGTVSVVCRSVECNGSVVDEDQSRCKACSIMSRNLLARKSIDAASVDLEGEVRIEEQLRFLSLDDQKAVALKVFVAGERVGLTKLEAAELAGDVIGCNEKTVRIWRKDWVGNKGGQFTPSMRGRHSKIESPFDDAAICASAKEWVKENSVTKGQGNMTVEDFARYCNETLLVDWLLERDRGPFSEESARLWLHNRLGYSLYTHKKGLYKDGHDAPAVITYRKQFVREMKEFDLRHAVALPVYDVNGLPVDRYEAVAEEIAVLIDLQRGISIAAMPRKVKRFVECCNPGHVEVYPHPHLKSIPGLQLRGSRPVIYMYEDESIFHTNQSQNQFWGETGATPVLKPKTEGRGIMVADFVLSIGKFVEFMTEDDWRRAELIRPGVKQNASVCWEYGKDREGYYTSDDFLPHVELALWIFHFSFPTIQLIGFFDQSGVHWRYGDDSLNASRLNLRKPGKVLLHDTTFTSVGGQSVKQKLTYFDDDEQEVLSKTLTQILDERGLWEDGMQKDDAVALLQSQPDFANEKCLLEKLFESYGDVCRPLPVCHPELDYLELIWAAEKSFVRKQGRAGIVSLRENVIKARDHVKADPLLLLHCFRKSRDFLHCYTVHEDARGDDTLSVVKTYKSHRRVFPNQLEKIRSVLPTVVLD